MWTILAERLHRSGAASAVFEYLRRHMPTRLRELLQQSRRGRYVNLRRNEPAIVGDFFFQNGNLRRIGQLFLEDLKRSGGRVQRVGKIRRGAVTPKRYEIALSFAGEDRSFVDQIARALRAQGVSVFYDAFEEVNLFGKDLAAHFGGIYKDHANYCAMFISEYYVRKAWPQLERQHAQARALVERREYILPIRLDGAEVPGLSPTIGYIDARSRTSEAIASILFQKIRGS
jgi:hypothetical protein